MSRTVEWSKWCSALSTLFGLRPYGADMYVGEAHYDLIDSELGRFVRKFGEFELLLRSVAVMLNPQLTWNQASLLRISDLLAAWVDGHERFSAGDREVMRQFLEFADEVVQLRHLMVHGRWYEVDAGHGEFMVELPMNKSTARTFQVPPTWPKGSHPATVMPMNPATIARAWRHARNLVRYIDDNLDRWEAHFRRQETSTDLA